MLARTPSDAVAATRLGWIDSPTAAAAAAAGRCSPCVGALEADEDADTSDEADDRVDVDDDAIDVADTGVTRAGANGAPAAAAWIAGPTSSAFPSPWGEVGPAAE